MPAEKILLVDDDRELVRGLSIRLKASGYEVIWAHDGYSAIQRTVEERPDVIILDLGLPSGDGFVVLRRLRELIDCIAIPVIVLTGQDPVASQQRALEAGAVFYFQKPADNEELLLAIREALGSGPVAEEGKGPAEKDSSTAGTGSILIVEDDKDLVRGLSIRLKASGYQVHAAVDVYTALSLAQREHPDLVLLDLGLPGGDGFTVMERLRSQSSLAAIPIIILTARDPASSRDRAMNAGASFFFQKPFDNDELLSTIQQVLSGERRAQVCQQ